MAGEVHSDEPAAGVRRLRFSNAGRRGALDHAILDGLAAEIRRAEDDADVRALLLTGDDSDFSSGYDIGDLNAATLATEGESLVAHPYASAIEALDATPLPTVAAIGGHAIGGGLELAVACDLRLARDGVRLGMPPAKLGLIYSHTGIDRFLRLVGEGRTRELFLLGRYIDARTAERWGLVNLVCDDGEGLERAALEWASELAANAPLSISGNKEIMRSLIAAGHELDDRERERLTALRESCFRSADMLEGERAFAEKRAPKWQGR